MPQDCLVAGSPQHWSMGKPREPSMRARERVGGRRRARKRVRGGLGLPGCEMKGAGERRKVERGRMRVLGQEREGGGLSDWDQNVCLPSRFL